MGLSRSTDRAPHFRLPGQIKQQGHPSRDASRQHAIEVMAIEKRDQFRVSVLREQ
jgi:hypothetical protein